MRSAVAALVVAAGLVAGRPARAEDPCADDVQRLCGGVRVGGGRVQECLRQNEANLSPACRDKRASVDARLRGIVQAYGAVCIRDAKRLCSEVEPGRGRVFACLARQLDDLSTSCRDATERIQAAGETMATVRAACRAEAARLCADVPPEAGALVECLRAKRAEVSDACATFDFEKAMAAAELVDAIETLKNEERGQELLQILQGIETIAFSRSQVLFQIDSYQGLGGAANANRLLFNPQVVFGGNNEFAVQLKVPVFDLYPYAADRPPRTGLGAVTTAFTWAFATSARVHQYASLGLQWISPVEPPIGAAWAITPAYALSVDLRPVALTGQVGWFRTFASGGYPTIDLLLFEPIVVVNLPGRSFVAVDTRLGWDLEGSSFVPVLKGIAGLYVDRRRSLSISAWYQASLTREAVDETFRFGVGTALAYFFDW